MKIWVTKYALSAGIQEYDSAEPCKARDGKMVKVMNGQYTQFFHKPDWHSDRETALVRAETMRIKKIESLEKSLKKFKRMSFK